MDKLIRLLPVSKNKITNVNLKHDYQMKKINSSGFFIIFIGILFMVIFLEVTNNLNLIYSQVPSDRNNSTDVDSVSDRLFKEFYPLVTVEYESNTLVVLRGDEDSLVLLNGTLAPLWNAIDIVENEKGFKMKEMITSGMGSKGNPTRIYAIMEK